MKRLNGFKLAPTGENVWNVFQDFEGEIYDRELMGTPQECAIIAALEVLCEEEGNGREELHQVLFEHDDHPILRAWIHQLLTNPKYDNISILDEIEEGKKVAKDVLSDLKVRECFAALRG